MSVKQHHVFQKVAIDTIEDVINGINATIFAYGQTGSGKTFTMTGGAEKYEDRGLIPRTISHLFTEMKRRTQEDGSQFRLMISYLEIYNDQGFDLLSTGETQSRKLEDLPKVRLREDEAGNVELRNLSVNLADSEEEALNLLFLGDTNRVVAETPMNDASTRSHCIFIVWVEHKLPNSDVVRRAKLHLVDLAGSERVFKTGASCGEKVVKEACSINLALFHLEQVISELHSRSKHVSYRNSTMTKVLRDSLGGNCKTRMIATCSAEQQFVDETISTCRFAQSVAAIKNYAKVNEEMDPKLLINRLKAQIRELKEEIKILRGDVEDADIDLTDNQRIECAQMVDAFLNAPVGSSAPVPMSANPNIMRTCFHIMRDRLSNATDGLPLGLKPSCAPTEILEELQETKELVRMRDVEITALVTRIGKLEEMITAAGGVPSGWSSFSEPQYSGSQRSNQHKAGVDLITNARQQVTAKVCELAVDDPVLLKLAQDRESAWAEFQRTYYNAEQYQNDLQRLKVLCESVKQIATDATQHRAEAARRTQELARLKFERGDQNEAGGEEDAEMVNMRFQIEDHAGKYRTLTGELREKKKEVEHLKHQIVTQAAQMQSQFSKWWDSLSKIQSKNGEQVTPVRPQFSALSSTPKTFETTRVVNTPPVLQQQKLDHHNDDMFSLKSQTTPVYINKGMMSPMEPSETNASTRLVSLAGDDYRNGHPQNSNNIVNPLVLHQNLGTGQVPNRTILSSNHLPSAAQTPVPSARRTAVVEGSSARKVDEDIERFYELRNRMNALAGGSTM